MDKSEAIAQRLNEIMNDGMLALLTSIGYELGIFEVMAGLPPVRSDRVAGAPQSLRQSRGGSRQKLLESEDLELDVAAEPTPCGQLCASHGWPHQRLSSNGTLTLSTATRAFSSRGPFSSCTTGT